MFMFVGACVLIVSAMIGYCLYKAEEAPMWVEQDEYYRSRWYK